MHKGQSEARAIKRGNIVFDIKEQNFVSKREIGKKQFQLVLKRNARLSKK